MGEDVARGLLAMREVGAWTVAQDEQSSVVFGMPRAAIERGAADEVCALRDIGDVILAMLVPGRATPSASATIAG